jgi:hypothetical protein
MDKLKTNSKQKQWLTSFRSTMKELSTSHAEDGEKPVTVTSQRQPLGATTGVAGGYIGAY